ncbi:MAG: hypothetical protein E6J66_07550 [Deltaproteobacteria bacterium]|nr:MAG: hypothetical protein E6J66_07550 [Deltaproteobacteria bacterium]
MPSLRSSPRPDPCSAWARRQPRRLIIGESVAPTMRINQEKFEQAVIEEMKGRLTKLENLGRQALPVGAMLHLRGVTPAAAKSP